MKIKQFLFNFLKCLTLTVLFFFLLFPSPWSFSFPDEKLTVLKVVDGDTLLVEYKGEKENVRLIGIDTPESRLNHKARKDAEKNKEDIRNIISAGRKATRFVQTLLKPGDELRIEFDIQIRDKYGRLLGYIYLSNGRMLNEEILRAGYAQLLTYPPNVKYVDRFFRAYREAREKNRGLWKVVSYKDPKAQARD